MLLGLRDELIKVAEVNLLLEPMKCISVKKPKAELL